MGGLVKGGLRNKLQNTMSHYNGGPTGDKGKSILGLGPRSGPQLVSLLNLQKQAGFRGVTGPVRSGFG